MRRLVLRDYQDAALQSHYQFFMEHSTGNPLFVIPTGGGKSVLIAEFIRESLSAWPDTRVLVVTHVKELIEQNYNEFVNQWGSIIGCPAGIYSAGLGRRETGTKILFAGIQSIFKRAEELGHFDLVLIDEAHLCPKKGLGRYRSYLDDAEKINPAIRVCGYTATHYRLDGGYLHEGEGRIFTHVAYEVKLETLIEKNHLVPLIAKSVEHAVDTSGIPIVRGDFKANELEEAAIEVVTEAVAEVVELARTHDRHHWLFFAAGVDHAILIVDALRSHDVDVKAIFGHTPKGLRDAIVRRFRDGDLQAVVNVGVLTTGFNAPRCDLIAMMRPTQSTVLYIQSAGRAMRTFPGKENALYLDYGGNVQRHGPINKVRPQIKGAGEGPAPTKICHECKSIIELSARECPDCSYVFPYEPPVRRQTVAASSAKPFDLDAHKPRWKTVRDWFPGRHEKANKPPSLRIQYLCGLKLISEWQFPEHSPYSRTKFARWWIACHGKAPIPATVDDALKRWDELDQPNTILVIDDNGYDRVATISYAIKETAH